MMYEGAIESLKQFPNAKVVGEVYGQATTAVAQAEVSKLYQACRRSMQCLPRVAAMTMA
jgi:ABC-type sugar transport system substrate-binding protein